MIQDRAIVTMADW